MKNLLYIFFILFLILSGCQKKETTTPTSPVNSVTAKTPVPGINGEVNALTVYNGNLIAGGQFTEAGGVSVKNIAQWNDTDWAKIGNGLNTSVSSLITYNNVLIAGCPGLGIFQWNGISWTQIAAGNSQSYPFTVYNNNLIVAGNFDSIGGTKANGLAQWNGTTWSAIDTGKHSRILSLTTYNGNLVAAGDFLQISGTTDTAIAEWNGSSWTQIGNSWNDAFLLPLTVYNNNSGLLYAGSLDGLHTFNGIYWNLDLLTYPPDAVYFPSFCSYNNEVIAAYEFEGTEEWQRQMWVVICEPNNLDGIADCGQNDGVNAVIQYKGNLIAGGSISIMNDTTVMNIAQWNGSTWSPF